MQVFRGGKKADLKIEELECKRKKSKKILKISIFLLIPVCVLLCVFFMWGFGGLSKTFYCLAIIFGFISWGAFSSKDESGCVVCIISAIIALGFGFCGHFFEEIASEEENDTPEELIVSQVDSVASTDDYENDLYSGTSA